MQKDEISIKRNNIKIINYSKYIMTEVLDMCKDCKGIVREYLMPSKDECKKKFDKCVEEIDSHVILYCNDIFRCCCFCLDIDHWIITRAYFVVSRPVKYFLCYKHYSIHRPDMWTPHDAEWQSKLKAISNVL